MYFAHASNSLSAVVRPLSVCFAVAVCCRLSPEALRLVRVFRETRVWSPTHTRLENFVAHAGPGVRAAASAEEAVRGADVVVLPEKKALQAGLPDEFGARIRRAPDTHPA